MTVVPLSPMFDPTDNPYMPRNLQNMDLALDPNDLAVPRPIPAAQQAPAMLAVGPMNEAYDEDDDDYDDDYDDDVHINSPVILEPLQEHEFPTYFRQMGSRLFYSHGSYVLPVDSNETKRQEAQHILLRMIIGSNYDAPIRALLNSNACGREVVDLCTGAGHWVLEMAQEFPHVQFHGLDLVPIQTRYPPDNVIFEIADVTNRLNFDDASVDVVHARMTCLSPDSIPGFLREVTRILRPGGLFLSAEWADPTLHPEHPWLQELEDYMPQTITFYDKASNVVPTLAQDIPSLIYQSGAFERPFLKRRAIPISQPHEPGSYGLRFVSEVMERVSQGYADALVAGRCVPPDVADNFKAELRERSGIVRVYQTVFARKSLEDERGGY